MSQTATRYLSFRGTTPHVQRRCKRKNRRANWKSLNSDSARARSQKRLKEAWRHAAPDARERIPPMGVVKRGLWARAIISFFKCDGVALFAVMRKVLSAEGLCLAKP